jgi:hypothetical protein
MPDVDSPSTLTVALLPPTSDESSRVNTMTSGSVVSLESNPPYIRYVLSTSNVPTRPPTSRDGRSFPINEWHALWSSKLVPIVRTVEFYDALCSTIVMTLVVGWFIGVALFLALSTFANWDRVFRYTVLYILTTYFILNAWFGRARKTQWQSIQDVLVDDDNVAARLELYGFNVECDYEFWGSPGSGSVSSHFCLYLIPIIPHGKGEDIDGVARNGYLRIQLFDWGYFGCKWTPVSLAHLASFDSLPNDFQPLESSWQNLWPKMQAISVKALSASRRLLVVNGAFFLLFLVMLMLPNDVADFFFDWFSVVGLPIAYWSLQHVQVIRGQRELIQEHVGAAARQGFHIEHRRAYGFSYWCGLHGVHYMYMFPCSTSNGDNL